MAHRLSAEAAAQLDEIWYYIAKESGSIDRIRIWGVGVTHDLRPGLRGMS
jgi:hypothetical protein